MSCSEQTSATVTAGVTGGLSLGFILRYLGFDPAVDSGSASLFLILSEDRSSNPDPFSFHDIIGLPDQIGIGYDLGGGTGTQLGVGLFRTSLSSQIHLVSTRFRVMILRFQAR